MIHLTAHQRKHPARAKIRNYALVSLLVVALVTFVGMQTIKDGRREERLSRRLLQEATPVPDSDECVVEVGGGDSLYPKEIFTQEEKKSGALILYVVGVVYMFFALAIVCDEFFVPSLEVIVEKLDISNDVAGATFMAAGGSAPELCTSLIGTFISKSNVGFGTIVGSAVFNVLFVIAMCALFSREVLEVTWWPLARDCLYYAFSLAILALVFGVITPNEIWWYEALILLALYAGYVTIMKFNENLRAKVYACVGYNKDNKVVDGDVEMANSTADGPKTPVRRNSEVHTFRAGFTALLIHNKPIEHAAALHIVAAIRGDVKDTFQKVDTDNSGFIDENELKQMLCEMGGHPTDEDVHQTMQHVDLDKDGKISFDEFAHWYSASEDRVKIELLQAFNRYDKDSSGYIDHKELKSLLDEMHGSVSEDFVKDIMEKLDQDKDGQLSRSEFEAWYCQTDFFHVKHHEAEQEAEDAEGLSLAWPEGGRARAMYLFLAPLTWSLYWTLPNVRTPRGMRFFPWGFIGSICWIAVFSYFMVWWAETIGVVLGIPPAVMGLTILAAGTSIPDLLTSVIVAKQGEGDMAVSSSIGSNIFDILVGLPVPWFLYSIIPENNGHIAVISGTLFLNVIILFGMLLSIILIIMLNKWRLTKGLAAAMLVLYFVYVGQDLMRVYLCL
jgi:K+-dependent Na+/Ca+ exchanger-like protein